MAVDPQPRTPWEQAVMTCTRRATTTYPTETTRILKGMAIVLDGGVTSEAGTCLVQSQRHADVQYKVNGVCTCYDAAHAPEGRCKHRWAKALYTKAMQEHTAQEMAHRYYATYYPADPQLPIIQGTAWKRAQVWVFAPEGQTCSMPVFLDRLVLGDRIDLCDVQADNGPCKGDACAG